MNFGNVSSRYARLPGPQVCQAPHCGVTTNKFYRVRVGFLTLTYCDECYERELRQQTKEEIYNAA